MGRFHCQNLLQSLKLFFSCKFQIYERSNKFVTSEKHILIFTYLNHTKVQLKYFHVCILKTVIGGKV